VRREAQLNSFIRFSSIHPRLVIDCTKITGGVFMQDVKALKSPLVRAGCGYVGLALLWIGVSLGLNRWEHTGCVFDLTAVIESKLLTVALIWLGRFGLFPRERLQARAKLWCGFCGLLLAGFGMIRTGQAWTWGYLMLVGADAALWAVGATFLLETLTSVYYRWWTMTAPRLAQLDRQWRLFWGESLKLGIWLALLLGLVFFYLVSFYRLDVYCYSQALTVGWATAILCFYGVAYRRLTGGVRAHFNLVEREIAGWLWGWPGEAAAEFNDQCLAVLQYLLLSRNYLKCRRRPALSGGALAGHLILAGFLLGLPQLIGIVLKV
jgi:hypothetical protein